MKNDKKDYLTLGEVAKILNINKTTLRHYNREGLIGFERDEENNYRYYHRNQIDNFKVILNLRKVGFSIEKVKEIKKYLIDKKYDLIIEMIDERLKEYDEEIKKIQKNMEILEENKKFTTYLNEITKADPEFLSINTETKSFLRKEEEIFIIKNLKGKTYGILCVARKISDKIAVNTLYAHIESKGYIEDGDMIIETVAPFGEFSEEKAKIKIFKIPIKPLTCHLVSGLE